ncbi:MAG: nucleoside-diphosphate sugar epimerase/dehydratase [Pyrinomonadaceae bacterium]
MSTMRENFWFLRRPVQFLADVAVLSIAFLIAYFPAVNIQLGEFYGGIALIQLPFVVLVQLVSLFLVGAYSIIWRYISLADIKPFIVAAIISCTILITFRFVITFSHFDVWRIPVSVILIDTLLAFIGLLSLRVARRFLYEIEDKSRSFIGKRRLKPEAALLVGAGRMGATLAKEMRGRADAELEIRGLVDDDPHKKGGRISGLKVLGTTHDLPRLVDDMSIERVVISIDHAQGKEIRRIMSICSDLAVKTQIVPGLNEIAHGHVSVSRIRDVQIEDLLGRETVKLDDDNLHEFLDGKTVMISGAGGSIGSELIRQIIDYSPGRLALVERSEFLLFQIGEELKNDFPDIKFFPLIADINDVPRMREIFEKYRPEVLFHAAAHKHVALMESNVIEAIKNNVIGTNTLATLAGECGTRDFVMISSDKAVNPTSVMGASKRMAEIVVQGLDQKYATNYIAVRFGNVLGSAGSVVPIFREQIRRGKPITVTDKEMTRYFMTIPEASQLVLQAGAIGAGGEIFILDMGEPVKILDLAEDMIRLSGLVPYEDIDIVFTGIKKGEKLFEELEITGEDLVKTRHPKIFIGKIAKYGPNEVAGILNGLKEAVQDNSDQRVRQLLNQFLPEAAISEAESEIGRVLPAGDTIFTSTAKMGMAEK